MAQVIESGETLTLILSPWEKLGAFHSNLTINKSNLVSVEEVPNPWTSTVLRGFRAPGTGIPFVIMLGTLRYKGGKDFAAVYRRRPVKIYSFNDSPYKRWIVSSKS